MNKEILSTSINNLAYAIPRTALEADHFFRESAGFFFFHHPYFVNILPKEFVDDNFLENLRQKKKSAIEAALAEDWISFIFIHDRPYRLDAFMKLIRISEGPVNSKQGLTAPSEEVLARLFLSVFSDMEGCFNSIETLKLLFERFRPFYLKEISELPDEMIIYRGTDIENDEGISWTLNKEVAEFFARRYGKNGEILSKTVKRGDLYAFIGGRNEEEVIYF